MYNFDIDILKWSIHNLYGINIHSLLEKIENMNEIDVIVKDGYYMDNKNNKYIIINGKIGKINK